MVIEKRVLKKVEDSDIVRGKFVVPSNITVIDDEAFKDCVSLKKVIIPDTVKAIGKGAFANCKNLKVIKLPKNLKEIQSETFKNCLVLNKIDIPNSVKSIGDKVFEDCPSLGRIKLSENLETIGNDAFKGCKFLPRIILPESLKSIGMNSFHSCYNLRSIVIPPNVKKIPKEAFSYSGLHEIKFPDNLKEIGESAFSSCDGLKEIQLPKKLNSIGSFAFAYCKKIAKIDIPENVSNIDSYAFYNCYNLRDVEFHEGLKNLGAKLFNGCSSLTSVKLPDSLENINSGLFYNCKELKNVHLPNNLKVIPSDMFNGCTALENIEIPDSVTKIDSWAFRECKKLKTIKFSEALEEIGRDAFLDCIELADVQLPASLKIIGELAFENCANLNALNVPENIEEIRLDCLKGCEKINSINVPENIKVLESPNESGFKYVKKADKGFTVLSEKNEKSVPLNEIKIGLSLFFKLYDKNTDVLKEQRNEHIATFYKTFIPHLNEEQLDDFMKNHNFSFFKQLMKHDPDAQYYSFTTYDKLAFYKGYYNLGGFKPIDTFQGGKKIDYSQKVSEKFISFIQNSQYSPFYKFANAFDGMNIEGFKKDYTDFFISNIDAILKEQFFSPDFVPRSYNEFEEIQATNTSDRGSQRQLKPTMEKFKSYFKRSSLLGLTPENKHIAIAIEPYFNSQKDFDDALRIMKEFDDYNVPEHILSEPLYEENPFEDIDELADEIDEMQTSTMKNMIDIANDQFTYEWLAKNDPTNLILGKLCSCCAHLHGAGYGIMHASIIHPNVQNLVIRNDKGKIFAKSTLYVNPDEQFGVLNNFEILNETFGDYKDKAYTHFMKGIEDFAKQYNKEHPDKPLKQINVGAGNNDLMYYLETRNRRATENLKALDYSIYGIEYQRYGGDSSVLQFVVWENEEIKNEDKKETEVEKNF